MSRLSISAALFDLDDTLLDRRESILKLTKCFISTFSKELSVFEENDLFELIYHADGAGYRPRTLMANELLSAQLWKNKPTEKEILDFWEREFPLSSILERNAKETLLYLKRKGIKTAIVTNGEEHFQIAKINQVDLWNYFDIIIISGVIGFRKPDIQIYNMTLEKLGSIPDKTVFIGDNPNTDIIGAKNAGLHTIWKKAQLPWSKEVSLPDFQIDKIEELYSIL
jgi:HAD superfamily hydrolase (TIGR01549 family)